MAPTPAWERTAWVTAATQIVNMIGFGLGVPFLPLYVQALGVHERAEAALWSGILMGAAAIPMSIMAPVWGALADRYGRKPMLVRSMLGGAALIAGMGFVGDVWQLLGLRLLQGGVTGSQAAASALVAAAAPARQIGFALGLVNTAIQVGNSIGPAVGGITVSAVGFRGSFLLGGLMLAAGGVMATLWVEEPPRAPRPPVGQARAAAEQGGWLARTLRPFTWPRFRGVLVLQMGTQFVFAAVLALLPLYLQDMARPGWLSPELGSGLSVTLTAVTAAAAMPVLGRWTDRHAAGPLLLVSLGGTSLVLIVQALIPHVGVFLALRVLAGVWLAGITATLGVLTKQAAPAGREGVAYGATSAAQAFGWASGPMVGSVVAAVTGIPLLYGLAGLATLALLLGALPPAPSVECQVPSAEYAGR